LWAADLLYLLVPRRIIFLIDHLFFIHYFPFFYSFFFFIPCSSDGAYVQVAGGTGSGHELLYFGAGDGTPFSLPSQLKNVKWGAWTSRCGWPVQGCWPKTSKEQSDSRISGVASAGAGASVEPSCAHRSKAWDLLAAGYVVSHIRSRVNVLMNVHKYIHLKLFPSPSPSPSPSP